MKKKMVTLALGMAVTGSALARGGSGGGKDDGRPGDAARGTLAWFTQETVEHEIRALLGAGSITEQGVSAVAVELTTGTTSTIDLTADSGVISDSCRMEDHASRHGTIIKKEVFCGNSPYYAAQVDASRDSNAWALGEAIEHATRILLVNDSGLADRFSGARAVFDSDSKVAVVVKLNDGSEKAFICNRFRKASQGNTVTREDLNCAAR